MIHTTWPRHSAIYLKSAALRDGIEVVFGFSCSDHDLDDVDMQVLSCYGTGGRDLLPRLRELGMMGALERRIWAKLWSIL